MRKFFFIATIAVLAPLAALAYQNPGSPSGFVNDFAGILSADQRSALESKITQFQKETTSEIAVVTIQSLNGDTIENFAEKLFKDWGIGGEEKDNGVLLLIARDDRKIRIEVGYGLEGALTDAQSFSIINDIISPAFKTGDYNGGVSNGVDAIIATTKGEYTTPADSNSEGNASSWAPFIFAFIFIGFRLFIGLAKSRSWWLGGVIGGVIGLIAQSLYLGLIFIGAGLLIDFLLSRFYGKVKDSGGPMPWWFTGFGGSGRGGGGGFGGFGGGRSGGGGSSGGW